MGIEGRFQECLFILLMLASVPLKFTCASQGSMRCYDTIFDIGEEAELTCTFGQEVHLTHFKWWYQNPDSADSVKRGVYTYDFERNQGIGHEDTAFLQGRTSSRHKRNKTSIQLLIRDSKKRDSGLYTCEAYSKSGESYTGTIEHIVTVPGNNLVQTYNVKEGHKQRLMCAFASRNTAISRVTWTHRRNQIVKKYPCHILGNYPSDPCLSNGRQEIGYFSHNNTMSLDIRNASSFDDGEYVCRAEGPDVSMFSSIRLRLGDPIAPVKSGNIMDHKGFLILVVLLIAIAVGIIAIVIMLCTRRINREYSPVPGGPPEIRKSNMNTENLKFYKFPANESKFEVGFRQSKYKDNNKEYGEQHPDRYYGETWGEQDIEAIDKQTSLHVQKGGVDQCVKIAIISTGINKEHPLLTDINISQYDAITRSNRCKDVYGEGTFLAGVIAELCKCQQRSIRLYDIKMATDKGKYMFEKLQEVLEYCQSKKVDIILAPHCVKNYLNQNKPQNMTGLILSSVIVFAASGKQDGTRHQEGNFYMTSKVIVGGHDKMDAAHHCQPYWGVDFLAPGKDIISSKAAFGKSLPYYEKAEGCMVAAAWTCGILVHVILQSEALTKIYRKKKRQEPISPFIMHEILRHMAKGNVRVEGCGFGPLKPSRVLLHESILKELLEALIWDHEVGCLE